MGGSQVVAYQVGVSLDPLSLAGLVPAVGGQGTKKGVSIRVWKHLFQVGRHSATSNYRSRARLERDMGF